MTRTPIAHLSAKVAGRQTVADVYNVKPDLSALQPRMAAS